MLSPTCLLQEPGVQECKWEAVHSAPLSQPAKKVSASIRAASSALRRKFCMS